MMLLYIALGITTLVAPSFQHRPIQNMTVVHVWKNLEYGFDCVEDYKYAIRSRSYIEEGFKRPYDVDMAIDKHGEVSIFIATPRIVNGIPYTLAKVSKIKGKYGKKLLAYPNFQAHSERDTKGCYDRIISVFRMYIDDCKRLWVIDNGRNFSAAPGPTQVCPPKIVAYDLATNKQILKYVIPTSHYNNQTVYNGIIVDINGELPPRGRCEQGKAYLTDARGFSLLVFDFDFARRHHDSWVIYNDLFKVDPAYGNTTINGETFPFPDGLYTTTPDKKRGLMYLHSLTSVSEVAVSLKTVNNRRKWKNNPSGNQDDFQVIGTRKTQCPVQAIDYYGKNVYFSQFEPLSILSWNPDKSYEPSNFKTLVVNTDLLQFVAGMKVRYNRDGKESLIAISNKLQRLNTGSIKITENNYYILYCELEKLQAGIEECGDLFIRHNEDDCEK
ncbi:major royal jelly protein 3-like [Episyrphus balteatus]|uniref:major royal jelly protein 3-like n=1 Tax=Episyrphus balteatus TaxID=286459 RepID=UPI00248674A5|nr:major royal jelly protein 3-like [Episyrphus balteatus]